jgi:hypothetical protein
MRLIPTETKFNKGLVHEANVEAGHLEKAKSGVSGLDMATARNLLATLEHMKKPSQSGEKGALTKAINHLSKAINDAKIAPGPAPFHPLNPAPIFKIRADDPTGGGGVIMKIRADDPVPVPDAKHDKVTSKRTGELGAAVHMLRTKDIKWTNGELDHATLGKQYARVAIEDHRATDGNAIFAYIPLGALSAPGTAKPDPNKVNSFFIQELPGRGGTARFSQEFTLPAGIEHAPKIMAKAEQIGEKVAENNGHRLSKSDAVHLRDLKPLGDGKFEAKFDVSLWMDDKKVSGHITATVDGNGKVLDKGTFKNVGAHAGDI